MMDFAQAMGVWVDEVIRAQHPRWLTKIGEHNTWWSRLFAFSFVKLSGYTVKQKRNHSMMSGKGFRPGRGRTMLSTIDCELTKWGRVVAKRTFPVNVRVD